jgi:hypothetical protein
MISNEELGLNYAYTYPNADTTPDDNANAELYSEEFENFLYTARDARGKDGQAWLAAFLKKMILKLPRTKQART